MQPRSILQTNEKILDFEFIDYNFERHMKIRRLDHVVLA